MSIHKGLWICIISFFFISQAFFGAFVRAEEKKEPEKAEEIIKMTDKGLTEKIIEKKEEQAPEKKEEAGKGEQAPEAKKETENLNIEKPEKAPAEEQREEGIVIKRRKGPEFRLKGMIKNLYSFYRSPWYLGEDPLTVSHKNLSADLTRIRISPEFRYRRLLAVAVDYDNELIWSNYGKSLDFKAYWRPRQYNDFVHMTWEPYRGKDLLYRTSIHRATVKVGTDDEDFAVTVGRQQIRFTSGRLWNPYDILNPISPVYIEPAYEQRGTEAVRFDVFPGKKSEITIILDLKRSNDKIEHMNYRDLNYLIRAKSDFMDVDIGILAGYVARRGTVGLDFSAPVVEGRLRGCLVVTQAEDQYVEKTNELTNDYNPLYVLKTWIPGRQGDSPVFFQANAGYEYAFKSGVRILVEYFFNQRGINYNKDAKLAWFASRVNAMDQKTYLQLANQFLTVNQHYVSVDLGYGFHPLVRGELFIIGDIQGRAIYWNPVVKVKAYRNLEFSAGVMGAFAFDNKASDFSKYRKNYLFYASGTYLF
jgi:hypothetical protein